MTALHHAFVIYKRDDVGVQAINALEKCEYKLTRDMGAAHYAA